jgi:hypothetical protein
MATLRDYFDTDFADCLRLQKELTISWATAHGADTASVAFTHIWDAEANARFGIFFVPTAAATADVCLHLIDDCEAIYQREWAGIKIMGGLPRGTAAAMKIASLTATPEIDAASALDVFDDEMDSRYLVETRQVYLYVERLMSSDERRAWCAYGRAEIAA